MERREEDTRMARTLLPHLCLGLALIAGSGTAREVAPEWVVDTGG